MAELSMHPGYGALLHEVQALHNTLASLIEERDELLFHICKSIEADYMIKLGTLELKAYEFQVSVLRLKRKIGLIQIKLNRQEPVFLPDIEEQLDLEYRVYKEDLKAQMERINQALQWSQGAYLSDEEASELKQLYHQITKKLHPDINPDQSRQHKALFLSAVAAYKNADLQVLKSISLLTLEPSSGTLTGDGMQELTGKRNALLRQQELLFDHIERIKTTYPYSEQELLADPARVKERQEQLSERIEHDRSDRQTYEDRLAQLLKGAI